MARQPGPSSTGDTQINKTHRAKKLNRRGTRCKTGVVCHDQPIDETGAVTDQQIRILLTEQKHEKKEAPTCALILGLDSEARTRKTRPKTEETKEVQSSRPWTRLEVGPFDYSAWEKDSRRVKPID